MGQSLRCLSLERFECSIRDAIGFDFQIGGQDVALIAQPLAQRGRELHRGVGLVTVPAIKFVSPSSEVAFGEARFPLCNRHTATKAVVIGLLRFSIRYRLFGCSGLRGARRARVFGVCSTVAV